LMNVSAVASAVRPAVALLAAFVAFASAQVGDRGRAPYQATPAEADRSDPWVVYAGGEGPGRGRHVVLVSGDEEYRSEEALPQLARILAVRQGFSCTVLFAIDPETGEIDPERSDHIPGLQALDAADLLVLFTRFRRLPDDDMRRIVEYVESGRPIVGVRTATHAFAYEADSTSPYARWSWDSRNWPGGFGRQVLGETWVSHHGRHGAESTRGVIPAARRDHPILRGVEEVWGPTDVYAIRELPGDATVLLEGEVLAGMEPSSSPVEDGRNDPRMPVLWIRERPLDGERVQRVVCSTLGAATDLESEGLRRALVNACLWAVGLEDAIPARTEVGLVGEYDPTPFGFGRFRRGVRPSDHELGVDSKKPGAQR
ncbi:MAG TPA: ThuA domain-containing protein, partial [Planctomycetota bacterium]|nr:ThuA domain-containing protein [Planctomycetota bacterium]